MNEEKKELTKEEKKLLNNCCLALLGHEPVSGTDVLLGIIDPMLGMYRKSLSGHMTNEAAKRNVELLFKDKPLAVLKHFPEHAPCASVVKSILKEVAMICPKCGNMIHKDLTKCPICSYAPLGAVKREEEPLRILQLRYVRGEITKEEYEEMKKTLDEP